MALELKIKDIVKWKMEAHEAKQKLKDDQMIQMELQLNRLEQFCKNEMENITHKQTMESETVKQIVNQLGDRIDQNDHQMNLMAEQLTKQLTKHLQSTVTEAVTDDLMQNIMP